MPNSALQPVSIAVFGLLNVASLKAAQPTGAGCVGGVTDNPPQGGTFPVLWYEVSERDRSGLGSGDEVKEVELRLHVFSTWMGAAEAQRIMAEAIRLVKHQEPAATAWRVIKIGRPKDVVLLPNEEINGVKVRELVSIWDVFAEEAA